MPSHCFGGIDARQQGRLPGGALRQSLHAEARIERDGIGKHLSQSRKPRIAQRIDRRISTPDSESVHEYK